MSQSTTEPMSFPNHARVVVRSVRGVFSEVLTTVGADAADPQSISRCLGLNKTLAWKISKIVGAEDPSVALEQMPGAAGIKILLKSIEKAGVGSTLLKNARDAVEEYEDLIRVHAGDRATLEMMGNELSPEGHRKRDENHRKLLFQGASYVWGAQARVILKVAVVAPGSAPGTLDLAMLSGLLDFRRIRPDVAWVMASRHMKNDDGTELSIPTEAIDSRFSGPNQPPLLGDFCSSPMPELRRSIEGAVTYFELPEGPVGNTAALTCMFGTMQRGVPRYRTPGNEWGEHSANCDIPAESLVLDAYFHRDLGSAIPPQAVLVGKMGPAALHPGSTRNRLPLHEPLRDAGMGALPLTTPQVPQHRKLVASVFETAGWDPREFHTYRLRMAFPAFPSALVLRYPLPASPGD